MRSLVEQHMVYFLPWESETTSIGGSINAYFVN